MFFVAIYVCVQITNDKLSHAFVLHQGKKLRRRPLLDTILLWRSVTEAQSDSPFPELDTLGSLVNGADKSTAR